MRIMDMLHLQKLILEMVATGRPLDVTMDRLCREVQAVLPEVICSVLRVDQEGLLHPLAAPSLPKAYCEALDGLPIGPNVGSCGSAAHRRIPVTVTDVATDPRWSGFEHYIVPLGLRSCWSSPILGADGRVLGTFAFYFREERGPTEQEEATVAACVHLCMIALERHERGLESDCLANKDALTGLGNRASFNRVLATLPCSVPGSWALLVIDLDNLKVTNDTFGHLAGDELLKEVAKRVVRMSGMDMAFRLGGDEFAVIVRLPDPHGDLDAIAQRILASLDQPVTCNGHYVHPRATIGGAILSADDPTAESVRQKADFALYHAKEVCRGGFVRYQPGIGTAITKRLTAIKDVNAALRDGRIRVYYQPVVALDTGDIVGAEALCRLITETGEVVSAAEFCEATLDAHVAYALTEYVLAQVVSDMRQWLDMGIRFRHLGINISYADIQRGNLGARLADTFAKGNVPLDRLVIEITENVYIDRHDHVIAREVAAMRALGIRLALDDFGTGYASLTHLLTVPVDIIKIDKSFIGSLEPGAPSSVIVDGLLAIARKLGIDVVAEGIERPSQLEQLRAYGGLLAQGYLFSKAVDPHAMTELFLQSAGARSIPSGIIE